MRRPPKILLPLTVLLSGFMALAATDSSPAEGPGWNHEQTAQEGQLMADSTDAAPVRDAGTDHGMETQKATDATASPTIQDDQTEEDSQ